jgi:hypothetical protein
MHEALVQRFTTVAALAALLCTVCMLDGVEYSSPVAHRVRLRCGCEPMPAWLLQVYLALICSLWPALPLTACL